MLGILELYIEKDLIKYAKIYKEKDEVSLNYAGEKTITGDLANVIDEIIEETNSVNSNINVVLGDFIEHNFEMPSILKLKDEKKAVEIEVKLFCNKNKFNFNEYTYKYLVDSQNVLEHKKNVKIYMISNSYLNYIIEAFNGKKLNSLNVGSNNGDIDFLESNMSFGKLMTSEISLENFSKFYSSFKIKAQRNFLKEMSSVEKLIIRSIICVLLFIIMYSIASNIIVKNINSKNQSLNNVLENSESELEKINRDIEDITEKTEFYNIVLNKKKQSSGKITKLLKDLNEIKGPNVEIISVAQENQIKIVVKSNKYEQLGEFKKKIDEEKILENCTIENTSKVSNMIEITLKGDLP